MFPVSLHEYCLTHGRHRIEDGIEQIMIYGSYPDILSRSSEDAIIQLQDLVSNYLYKDLLLYDGIQKSSIIIDLLRLLAHQIGNEVSYAELANMLKISATTVEKYIDLLEKSFVIIRLSALSRNPRNEIRK